jgi:hypothetical protein
MYSSQFHAKSQGQALHTSRFALLTPSQFLRTLSHAPSTTQDCSMLALTPEDHETFKALNNRRPDIKKVVTALTGRKKKGVKDAQMDMDGEGDEDQSSVDTNEDYCLYRALEPTDAVEVPRSGKFDYHLIQCLIQCADKNWAKPNPNPRCGQIFGGFVRTKITRFCDFWIRDSTGLSQVLFVGYHSSVHP